MLRERNFRINKCNMLYISGETKVFLKGYFDQDLSKIRTYIRKKSGINFSDIEFKKLVVPFLRDNCIDSYRDFLNFININKNFERLMDAVTFKASSFFRHTEGLEYLVRIGLKEILKLYPYNKQLRILVAGCSRGEEAYTLAILLKEYFKEDIKVNITAVDISPQVIREAKEGIYPQEKLKHVPQDILEKYFTPEKRDGITYYRVNEDVKKINFRVVNLMGSYPKDWSRFDAITCRNVMTWFNESDKKRLLDKLHKILIPGGFLVIGKEPMPQNNKFKEVIDSVYRTSY